MRYLFISLIFKSILRAIQRYKRYSTFVGKYKQPTAKESDISYYELKINEDIKDMERLVKETTSRKKSIFFRLN